MVNYNMQLGRFIGSWPAIKDVNALLVGSDLNIGSFALRLGAIRV